MEINYNLHDNMYIYHVSNSPFLVFAISSSPSRNSTFCFPYWFLRDGPQRHFLTVVAKTRTKIWEWVITKALATFTFRLRGDRFVNMRLRKIRSYIRERNH